VDDANDPIGGPHGRTDPPAVACDGMVIRYGETLAVDRLSLVGHAGQVVALLGPNGAGKTSTVEALEGYRTVDAGSARVLGLDPIGDHAALVPRIGVMLQKGGVYPMLGPAQVLHLFARYYDDAEDPDDLLDLVGLSGVRRTPWRRLSGGEQQRLALALALVGKPRVLFLDEPTAGVDPEGRIVVRDIIAAQRDRGICVILTTHELAEAERLADHVVIIDHGRILAEGSPAELASGTSDGTIRFSTQSAIDTAALAAALSGAGAAGAGPSDAGASGAGASGAGATVTEERPGVYRLLPPAGASSPTVVAALAGWLAERDLSLGDLRTGQSLEEAYLSITAARGEAEPPGSDSGSDSDSGSGSGPSGRRRSRSGSRGRDRRSSRGADR
jgi:ABC-2 type transport system ATP-binding protein